MLSCRWFIYIILNECCQCHLGIIDCPHPLVDLEPIGEFGQGSRKRHRDPTTWQRNIRKQKYNSGRAVNVSSCNVDQPRAPRDRPCGDHVAKPVLCCREITESMREQICKRYWGQASRQGRWGYEAHSVDSVSNSSKPFQC